MRLYLVQHGEAVSKEENPDRPLTGKGENDVQAVGRLLEQADAAPARVVHSGKTRARQTAEILAGATGAPEPEEAEFDLDAKASTDGLAAATADWHEPVMVVGHQPFMGNAVGRLTGTGEGSVALAFRPGTVVALERDDAGQWNLAWMVRPDVAG